MTEELVKKCSADYLKVVLDYQNAKGKKKKEVDTGYFKRIYQGPVIHFFNDFAYFYKICSFANF